jgi:hypothetical protein
VFGGAFEDQNSSACVAGRQRCAQSGVSASDHDDVILLRHISPWK